MIARAIDRLLRRQQAVVRLLDKREYGSLSGEELAESIRMNVLAATDELHEVLDTTGWKPWKTTGYGHVNRKKYIEELADVWLFLFNLMLLQRVSGREIVAALRAAWKKNTRRQRNGY